MKDGKSRPKVQTSDRGKRIDGAMRKSCLRAARELIGGNTDCPALRLYVTLEPCRDVVAWQRCGTRTDGGRVWRHGSEDLCLGSVGIVRAASLNQQIENRRRRSWMANRAECSEMLREWEFFAEAVLADRKYRITECETGKPARNHQKRASPSWHRRVTGGPPRGGKDGFETASKARMPCLEVPGETRADLLSSVDAVSALCSPRRRGLTHKGMLGRTDPDVQIVWCGLAWRIWIEQVVAGEDFARAQRGKVVVGH